MLDPGAFSFLSSFRFPVPSCFRDLIPDPILVIRLQLSTRKKDYVIDALEPSVRDGLEALNEFFTDPEWVKVRFSPSSVMRAVGATGGREY